MTTKLNGNDVEEAIAMKCCQERRMSAAVAATMAT
jgi:hypothetical protein